MSAPKEIKKLVERFCENRQAYRSSAYNEAQLRHEFIDPFFKALGWDVDNEQGFAEAYKDVIHEDAIKIGGATKAPDYCFRIGGTRKFFVEAKRPSVGIKDSPEAAYQLRRYAWSGKLPLSILTDFEEFAVYDCRFKPSQNEKSSTARTIYLTCEDYVEKWEEIASVFARDAVLKGSFDKYVESTKRKKGTAEVDDAFLKEIEGWRDVLARNIALRNTKLSTRELNFAVQRTVDRLIFLRICEDRGVEEYGQLMALENGSNTYKRLCQIFRQADERYNSGLFHFRKEKERAEPPDDLTLNLDIDDKVLKGISKELYYPESPYEFSVLPADILGHIYEQFLGKVIRLTPAHHAKVEDKPQVKKAGGVYYTPTYIVDYIVEHTVGKLLDGKTPKQVEKLKILDPACGSGSFLLGAYQRLLNWHRDHYVENDPKKHAKGRSPKLFQGRGGEWRLTTAEKKRILLNNIYGVDIDPQAVEVTKLSLLLKVLEGESSETLGKTLRMFHERALPDLGENIKCGNSLIGPDFYEGKQLSLIDEEERYRINAFDWDAEFPEIMAAGGFDAVIGNPPWGGVLTMGEKEYLMRKFAHVHMRTPDTFNYFLAQGCAVSSSNGRLGMIVPNNFLFQHEYAKARQFFIQEMCLAAAINLGDSVFAVTAPSCIVVIEHSKAGKTYNKTAVADLRNVERRALALTLNAGETVTVNAEDILTSPGCTVPMNKDVTKRIARILQRVPTLLGDVCDEVASGIGTGGDKVFRIEDKAAKLLEIERDLLHPVLIGREMNAYYVPKETGHSIIYSTKAISGETHPKALEYLKSYQAKLAQKRETRKGLIPWWSLHWPRNPELFNAPKIVLRQTADSLYASLDEIGYYCLDSIIIIRPKDADLTKYYIGLLNSCLVRWIYGNLTQEQYRTFPQVKSVNLRKLPIRTIDFSDLNDKTCYDLMVEFVDTMLDLHRKLAATKTDHERSLIQRQIDTTDKQIDQLVYELYGLTDKEIKIVEEATG